MCSKGDWLSELFVARDGWAQHDFSISESSVNLEGSVPVAEKWEHGIKLNLDKCKELGMSNHWVDIFENGTDLMLEKLPPIRNYLDNYSSATDPSVVNVTDSMIRDQINKGVVMDEASDVVLNHPLGLVEKKREPGYTGPPKYRVITDAHASGLNDCIRDRVFSLPTIDTVVLGTKIKWVLAKYDLKNGFYHIGVKASQANLLGVKKVFGEGYCTYRFLCFGIKCAPFIFQGSMHG